MHIDLDLFLVINHLSCTDHDVPNAWLLGLSLFGRLLFLSLQLVEPSLQSLVLCFELLILLLGANQAFIEANNFLFLAFELILKLLYVRVH